ncbi:PREDICTED: DNA-directed RNA polymerase I subunit RPA12 [Tarenaya hassleriana]|uniref:DNA-directed RNA polymerase I subunit RPA12 n=1 Tax=Tarenaya hassleriana TaxID=28532 RepID=UPI00053C75F4|nr:PREDICTED: DNA-directed RNA polymerase I subunit RPA12 [Tarenaya hassleriana]XP_010536410.1 PREDICTED: DNA-directed RNA polymerase I subunit RPA12 [Tarenaya hassleriana]XP_010536411.1 PREDICTED: DNA-directed RNA polymerase I subunit RPA12 [Tarenaya hassleriana]
MAKSLESGFLFCNLCGTMLILKSPKYAECPLCLCKRDAREIIGKEISYTVSAEDIRRELGISLFDEGHAQAESELPKIKKMCEKCGHPELVYTTRQTRSADEGQTTYYTCPNCGHRFTEG